MTRQEAIDLILRGSGSQYDPRVVGTFIAHLPEFEAQITAHRGTPQPKFGIEATEQLSEAAKRVAPAAGLAEDEEADKLKDANSADDAMSAICDLAQAVIGARSQDEVINVFTEKIKSVVPHSMCAITLVDAKTGQNVVAHAAGSHWMFLKGRVIGAGEGVTGWVLANRKPFCNTDPRLDLPPSVVEQSPDYKTLAAFPIIKDATTFGAVSIYSSTLAEYTPGHQKLMREAISLFASALSAVSDGGAWENRIIPLSEERHSAPLNEWVPDYDVTH
jgi:transcriptional regulator with GAF, ATPase, and Fis domain